MNRFDIVITVDRGLVEIESKRKGVSLQIRDYDIEGTCKQLLKDANERECIIEEWERSEEV